MSRSAFDAHPDPFFQNLKIPNLESIYKLHIGKFMYQYRSGLLPYSLCYMFWWHARCILMALEIWSFLFTAMQD